MRVKLDRPSISDHDQSRVPTPMNEKESILGEHRIHNYNEVKSHYYRFISRDSNRSRSGKYQTLSNNSPKQTI